MYDESFVYSSCSRDASVRVDLLDYTCIHVHVGQRQSVMWVIDCFRHNRGDGYFRNQFRCSLEWINLASSIVKMEKFKGKAFTCMNRELLFNYAGVGQLQSHANY